MQDKVIVITGAAPASARAAAGLLAERGAAPVLVARRKELLDEVAAACGAEARVRRRRRDPPRPRRTASWPGRSPASATSTSGSTTPAAGSPVSRRELTDEDFDEMMLVNVKSALYGMQAVLPHFQARGRGHIINISSMLGRVPLRGHSRRPTARRSTRSTRSPRACAMDVQRTHPADPRVARAPRRRRHRVRHARARHGGIDSRADPDAQSPEEVAEVIADVVETRAPTSIRVLWSADGGALLRLRDHWLIFCRPPRYSFSIAPGARPRGEVVPLRNARRAAGRGAVVAMAARVIAGHLEQMRAHGVEAIVAGQPPVGVERSSAARARPPGRAPWPRRSRG